MLRDPIRNLNTEIIQQFLNLKSYSIRWKIISGTLWDAVKVAKDINIPKQPREITLNDSEINAQDLPDAFASLFNTKVLIIVNDLVVSDFENYGQMTLILCHIRI